MSENYRRPALRLALMGLGRAMFDSHFPVFEAHPALFNVVAACDLEKPRRDRVAKSFPKCRMFRQFGDMLDERDIDLVLIALPNKDRTQYILKSIQRGFWTLIESPFGVDLDEANVLRGAALKSRSRLAVVNRSVFEPDFMLARQVIDSGRLGKLRKIEIRRNDYIRRDDWQAVRRQGGGATQCIFQDMILQALRLLPGQPAQMWSDLKRIASLGDSEDYAHLALVNRDLQTADVEYNGGFVSDETLPSFRILGDTGTLSVMPGAREGKITVIDPGFKPPRRRTSIRTPSLKDLHEEIPMLSETVSLDKFTQTGKAAFWHAIYSAVRTAVPLPFTLEESMEAVKIAQLMRRSSPFGR